MSHYIDRNLRKCYADACPNCGSPARYRPRCVGEPELVTLVCTYCGWDEDEDDRTPITALSSTMRQILNETSTAS